MKMENVKFDDEKSLLVYQTKDFDESQVDKIVSGVVHFNVWIKKSHIEEVDGKEIEFVDDMEFTDVWFE